MEKQLLSLDLRHDSSGRSKHERLRDHLVNEMVAGRLKPGQMIPSQRQLVEMLRVAPMTVRQAMASLENEGLIRRVQGKGTFIEDDARQKLQHGLDIFALIAPQTHGGFYPSLLHGFETAAGQLHHQAIICSTDNNIDRQANIILQLFDKKVGGVAIVPTTEPPTPAFQIKQLQERGIPVVLCHRPIEGITAPLLTLPFRKVARLAGKTLIEHGHQRLVFFSYGRTAPADAFEKGLQEALRAGNGDGSVESVYIGGHAFLVKEEMVWTALQQVFAKPTPPTAIFTSFDSLAEVIYMLLPRLGLRVPEDVSLLGFGGAWREGVLAKRLTSVVIDEIATGRQAVTLLHEMRRGDRAIDDKEEFVLELGLSEGETLAVPSPSK